MIKSSNIQVQIIILLHSILVLQQKQYHNPKKTSKTQTSFIKKTNKKHHRYLALTLGSSSFTGGTYLTL